MPRSVPTERVERAREVRLRQLATDQGLGLEQESTHDPQDADLDHWLVIDPSYGWAIATQPTLDQVESFLKRYRGAADPP